MIALDQLRRADRAELERIYATAVEGGAAVPTGGFRGHHLGWTGTRSPWRPLLTLGFVWTPFGIDFDARLWFFWHRRIALGRFEARVGRSRWRETETVRLSYQASRLPGPVRGALYDEVKPLSPSLCLGLGGLDGPRGVGDLFFFALERL